MASLVEITGSCQMFRTPLGGGNERITFAWVTSTTDADIRANIMEPITGVVYKLETTPLDSPTANYDVTLIDETGHDVLLGQGIDRSSTATETAFVFDGSSPELQNLTSGKHRLRILSAGTDHRGIVEVTILNSAPAQRAATAGEPIADSGGFESPGGFS